MNVICVGHGPSLIGKGYGSYIDTFEYVVRMKNCGGTLGDKDYGERMDALCLSTEVLGIIPKINPRMFWLYAKNGNYDQVKTFDAIASKGAPFMIPLALMVYWNGKFEEMGAKHPNVSTGMASIIIAAHYLEPDRITLAGFDTLLDTKVKFTRNDSIPRTGVGVIHHDWETENKLLKVVADSYKFEIHQL